MFFRLVYQSFRRQRRSKLLAGVAITLGVTVATAMIAVAAGIGDKVNRELQAFGANIVVSPADDRLDVDLGGVHVKPSGAAGLLKESYLPRIKGIFWRHNILGFAPFLPVQTQVASNAGKLPVTLVGTYFAKSFSYGKENFTTGVRTTHPWWRIEGNWPREDTATGEVLLGNRLARKVGAKVGGTIRAGGMTLNVVGILDTGGSEDDEIVSPLSIAQAISRQPGAVRTIYVSALTKPEDNFARRDPKSLSPADRDRWYCSPYANSIAFQLTEAIPNSRAEQIRQVAQNEGLVLSRVQGFMLLITLAALLAAGLAVSAAMATALMERRREVALMKALGATRSSVMTLFFTEAALLALLGGLAGFFVGSFLAKAIGWAVFATQIGTDPAVLPIVLFVSLLIVVSGSAAVIRRASNFSPALALRGDL